MAELFSLFLIFLAGIGASSFGTLIGGAGLLIIPFLIFLGLPVTSAIGTHKAGVLGLTIAGWYEFDKKHEINYKIGWHVGIAAMLGSILGSFFVFQINESLLEKMVIVFTLAVLIFMVIEKDLGIKHQKIKNKSFLTGTIIAFFLGIYGGFYGVGVGTFFSYLLILVFGLNFIEGAATRKIAGFLVALVSFAIFAMNDSVVYSMALALFAGNFIGSYIGAAYADKIGNVWIKRAFVGIVLAMTASLLL